MKKVIIFGLAVIVFLSVLGCSAPAKQVSVAPNANYSSGERGSVTYTAAATKQSPPMITVPSATAGKDSAPSNQAASSALPSSRMIVRTGSLQMVVNQISVALEGINQLAVRHGGYVVNSQQWKENERNVGNISIRVLAENYDIAMAELRNLAKSITSESSSSQDVSEEYSDLDARIKNLQATEIQLLKIMADATRTEDILSIQRELTNVRAQIEQIRGRMLFLERTSSTSLININLEEAVLALKFTASKVSAGTDETIKFSAEVTGGFPPYNYYWLFGDGRSSTEASPTHSYRAPGNFTVSLTVNDDKGYSNSVTRVEYINIIGTWKPSSVASSAWNGFIIFGKGLINLLIWLGVFGFVWIPAGVLIWYFAYYRRRKLHKK
ncbi:MAG TPA: DUF4349 domain-containing protein [Dehalococcoidales bacterium]|nr:DUF4349 domain-containing protein [Dehalococcoidales bacterium]